MRINYHEHAFQVSELLKGDELDKIENSIKEFKDLYKSGFEGYVDATPLFLGRNIEGLATLIERTNLKVFRSPVFIILGIMRRTYASK